MTGFWNLGEIDATNASTAYQITLFIKIALAMVPGAAEAVHQAGRSKAALAVGGAVGFFAAPATMYCGYLLTTGA